MYFVCTSQPFCVPIIGVSKKLETLMNKNIMHYKISSAIRHNSQTDRKSCPKAFVTPEIKTGHTNDCIEDKKGIITLKPTFVIFVMVVFVKLPQKTMHDVFMCKPRHKLHGRKGSQKNEYP